MFYIIVIDRKLLKKNVCIYIICNKIVKIQKNNLLCCDICYISSYLYAKNIYMKYIFYYKMSKLNCFDVDNCAEECI